MMKLKDDKFYYTVNLHEKCNIHGSRLVSYDDVIFTGRVIERLTSRYDLKEAFDAIKEEETLTKQSEG